MIEIITPSLTVGWLSWEFLAKSIEIGDSKILSAINQMIGFRLSHNNKNYYFGDLTEDLQLQYMYNGAYETKKIEKNSTIFYTKEELLSMLCEQYESATHKQLKLK